MAITLDFDISQFHRFLETAGDAVYTGAKRGLHDAMDDWLADARDVAPLAPKGGNLRKQMHTKVKGASIDDLKGTIYGNAVEDSRKYGRFNYGYWLHETSEGQATQLHTPGTVHKFLDVPAEQNKQRYFAQIEREIQAELRARGLS